MRYAYACVSTQAVHDDLTLLRTDAVDAVDASV